MTTEMRSVKQVAAAGLLIGVLGSVAPAIAEVRGAERLVSIVHLITRPQELEGLRVRAAGFLSHKTHLWLWLSDDYARIRDIGSAILVDSAAVEELKAKGCLDRYVAVVGEFRRRNGEFGIWRLDEVWAHSETIGTMWICWHRDEDTAKDE